jgi:GNAT superfamily N-acetyltransferase
MEHIVRTNSEDHNFIKLVALLDSDLAKRDGEEHGFYDQFNKIDQIKHAVVFYLDTEPVGCGAIKEFQSKIAEVKRMYTLPEVRGKGIASKILAELESWAYELSFEKCVLETGKKQPEAINLYKKNGYKRIPNYGQYAGIENSLCFEKKL